MTNSKRFLSIFMTAVLALGAVGMLPAEKKSIPAKAVGSESLSGYKSMRVKSDEEGYDFLVYYPDKYDIVDSDVILDSYVEDHCTLLKGITIGADLPGGWFKLGVKVYDKVYNKVSLTYDSQDFYPDLEEDGKTKEALEKPGHVKNRMLTGTGSYYNGIEWKELFEVSKDENIWRYKNFEKIVIDIDGPEVPWHYYTAKLTDKKLDKQADFLSATNMTSFEKDDRIHLSYGSTTGGKVYEDPLSDDSFDPPYDKFNKYVGSVSVSKLIKDDEGNTYYLLITRDLSKTLNEETFDYSDSKLFLSWEEFYTDYLEKISKGTIFQYSKSKLREEYKSSGSIDKIKSVLPEQIRP